MSNYRYRGEPEQRVFGPLPEGDYQFVVAEIDEPYTNPKSGNDVLPVKLSIQPQGVPVFANPWTGTDKNRVKRDGIAEFLLAINRTPALGAEPDWKRLVGAKGKCRLKVEIAAQGSLAGKEVNKVAWFHRPRQVGPTAEQPPRQSFTEAEIKASQAAISKTLAGKDPDLDVAPDDIPF
jgi:hypothetical protein